MVMTQISIPLLDTFGLKMTKDVPDHEKYPNRWAHFGKLYEGSVVKNETDQPEEVLAPERRKRIEDDEEV